MVVAGDTWEFKGRPRNAEGEESPFKGKYENHRASLGDENVKLRFRTKSRRAEEQQSSKEGLVLNTGRSTTPNLGPWLGKSGTQNYRMESTVLVQGHVLSPRFSWTLWPAEVPDSSGWAPTITCTRCRGLSSVKQYIHPTPQDLPPLSFMFNK